MLVVGAGFAGSVMAERLAASGRRVLVVDRREHIAGNAYDFHDASGVLIHRYGPHIFHTNSDKVLAYLSRFTDWRPYEHRVLADVGRPRCTCRCRSTATRSTRSTASSWPATRRSPRSSPSAAEPREKLLTSEDVVVAKVGRDLYERLFRGYTRKQWGLDPSELHAQVCARIPVRTNLDDRYFGDAHQCMPADGYTALFARLLEHPRIEVRTGVESTDVREDHRHLVWTGPIDEYFGRRYGALPYRSLRFVAETYATPKGELLQPVAVDQPPRRGHAVHARHRVPPAHRPAPHGEHAALRDPQRRGRPLLPRAAAREPAPLRALRRAGRR